VTIHDAARGFERAAPAYERARPEYPAAAVAAVVRALALGPGRRVLDVGAGTGKFSRVAAATGAEVVAVDPAAAMIRVAVGVPGLLPLRAVAELLPFRDGSFDAASAASAFHWFEGARALRELHRLLRPGGRLALLWNLRDDGVPWVARLSAIVNRGEGSAPRYRAGNWRAAFEAAPGLFEQVEEAHLRHVHPLAPQGVVDRVASVSFVAAMEEAARDRILAEVRGLLASHPGTAGRAEVELAYLTDVYVYERR
jgi:SAM-dependent methyltransferase